MSLDVVECGLIKSSPEETIFVEVFSPESTLSSFISIKLIFSSSPLAFTTIAEYPWSLAMLALSLNTD